MDIDSDDDEPTVRSNLLPEAGQYTAEKMRQLQQSTHRTGVPPSSSLADQSSLENVKVDMSELLSANRLAERYARLEVCVCVCLFSCGCPGASFWCGQYDIFRDVCTWMLDLDWGPCLINPHV